MLTMGGWHCRSEKFKQYLRSVIEEGLLQKVDEVFSSVCLRDEACGGHLCIGATIRASKLCTILGLT